MSRRRIIETQQQRQKKKKEKYIKTKKAHTNPHTLCGKKNNTRYLYSFIYTERQQTMTKTTASITKCD